MTVMLFFLILTSLFLLYIRWIYFYIFSFISSWMLDYNISENTELTEDYELHFPKTQDKLFIAFSEQW